MSPTQRLVVDARTRRAAIYAYADRHDQMATTEQALIDEYPGLAQDARDAALILARAWLAEVEDRQPEGLA